MYCVNFRGQPLVKVIKKRPVDDPQMLINQVVGSSGGNWAIARVRSIMIVAGGDPAQLGVMAYVETFRTYFPPAVVQWTQVSPYLPGTSWDVSTDQAGNLNLMSRGWHNVLLMP